MSVVNIEDSDQWINQNKAHLDKLQDWLNTPVDIMVPDTDHKTFSGNILEVILTFGGEMTLWICEFLEYIKTHNDIDVQKLIDATVLPVNKVYNVVNGRLRETLIDTFEESKKQEMYVATLTSEEFSTKNNLLNLCNAILKLDEGQLQALKEILCSDNRFRFVGLYRLDERNRENQGFKRTYVSTHDSVSPWVKKGGRRTRRHKKRSGHKRSGHKKRSAHTKRSVHKSRRR